MDFVALQGLSTHAKNSKIKLHNSGWNCISNVAHDTTDKPGHNTNAQEFELQFKRILPRSMYDFLQNIMPVITAVSEQIHPNHSMS